MLGQTITCHDDRTQEVLGALEKKHGAFLQCRTTSFWRGLSSSMLNYMMCDALHEADSGEGVVFLTNMAEAPPYRVAPLLDHRHSRCEVISDVTLPLIEWMTVCRETMTSSKSHKRIAELGGPEMSSLWHQRQENPPFVLKHNLYEY